MGASISDGNFGDDETAWGRATAATVKHEITNGSLKIVTYTVRKAWQEFL